MTTEPEHIYPSDHTPGPRQPISINVAWWIVDHVKPGVLSGEARALLAGMISARLDMAAQTGKVQPPSGVGPPYAEPDPNF